MDINIRYHIINNFKGDNFSTLKNAIEESVKEKDELTQELKNMDWKEFLNNEIIKVQAKLETTEITPSPPAAISGKVRESSPLNTQKSGFFLATRAITSII